MKTTTEIKILDEIAESTQMSRKQVAAVLDELAVSIRERVNRDCVFTFSIPGLMTFQTVMKRATSARQGINPFTKESVTFRARPASISAKIRTNGVKRQPKKTLKDMVSTKPKGN